MCELKARLDVETSALQVQVHSLQAQLTNQKLLLRGEEGLRRRIEADYRKVLDEKRTLIVRYMNISLFIEKNGVGTSTT